MVAGDVPRFNHEDWPRLFRAGMIAVTDPKEPIMESYWQHHAIGPFPPLTGDHTCDVAIIGAGYTGSWLAYWLGGCGLKTVVLEQERPGFGASGRNGGLLLQGPAELLGAAAGKMGRDLALSLWQWTRHSFEWVKELDRKYDLDFHVTGSLYVGGGSDERPILEETVGLMNGGGVAARLIPREQQPYSIQRLGYDLGMWVPDDAMVHPLKLIAALLAEALAGGVQVHGSSAVKYFDGATLSGDQFNLKAEVVLVASNAYTPEWLPALTGHINPVRGQMLATEPLQPLDHRYPVYADHGFNYWHQRPDGRLLAGGFRHLDPAQEVGTDLVLHDAIQERLTRLVKDLAGPGATVADRWAGIMAMTEDHLPYVGMLTPRLGVAVGYSGHGSTVTPIAAKMLKDQLIAGTPVLPPLSVSRIAPGSQT